MSSSNDRIMKPLESLIDYLRSSKSELEKVSWPSREQTVRYSAMVLGVSIVIGLFFAGLDFGLNHLIDTALSSQTPAAQEAASQPTPNIPNPEQPAVTVSSSTNPLFAPSGTSTPQQ